MKPLKTEGLEVLREIILQEFELYPTTAHALADMNPMLDSEQRVRRHVCVEVTERFFSLIAANPFIFNTLTEKLFKVLSPIIESNEREANVQVQ